MKAKELKIKIEKSQQIPDAHYGWLKRSFDEWKNQKEKVNGSQNNAGLEKNNCD